MTKPWSYTHIKTFEQCPRKYHAQYELKKYPYVETPAIKEGKFRHQAFELRIKGSLPLPADLEKYEPWIQRWEAVGKVTAELALGFARDLQPRAFFDKDVWWRGQLDVVVRAAPSSVLLFDWKNGNPDYPDPFQLELNALGLFARDPGLETVTAAHIWLKTGRLGEVHRYTRAKDAPMITADMFKRVERLETARSHDIWPEVSGPLCGYCPVKECQHNRA